MYRFRAHLNLQINPPHELRQIPLVPRHRPEALADRLQRHEARSAELLQQDRAFVYGGFNLETVL